jgi:uncharacterized protein
MSDAKTQQEPSMEEILASIRRIISEDGDDDQMPLDTTPKAAKQDEEEEAIAPLPIEEDEQAPSPLVIEEDELPPAPPPAIEEDVLELTDVVEEPADETPEIEEMSGLDPEPDLGGLPPLGDEDDTLDGNTSDEEESIISSATAAIAGAALSRLTEAPKEEAERPGRTLPIGNGAKTLEDMVRELLRPMLREWLDQHLPDIVEEIVSREVEKIGRGRGSGRR